MRTRELINLPNSGHAGINALFSKAHSAGWDIDRDVDWTTPVAADDSLVRQRLHAIAQIVLHLAAPLAMTAELVGFAKASGPAEIGLKHRVSAPGDVLHPGIEFESVARLRSAMHQQNER